MMAAFAATPLWDTTATPTYAFWTAGTTNYAAPAALTQVAQAALTGLALARTHLARLARPTAPEPPEPLGEAPVAPWLAVATVREHRLRPGSRRRARPK